MSDAVAVSVARSGADRETLFRIRYEVYVDEMRVFGDVADHDRRLLTDEHDQAAHLLLASVGDEPVGTMRISYGDHVVNAEFEENYDVSRWCPDPIPPDRVMVCSKFAVRPEHRRGLVPFELLRATVRFGVERGVEIVFCDCQPHLVTLYTALGFRSYRPAYHDPHVAATIPLVLIARDLAHLERLQSPLLEAGCAELRPTALTRAALDRLPAESVVMSAAEGVRSLRQGDSSSPAGGPPDVSVFAEMSEAELDAVVERGQMLTFAEGDPLIGRGHGTRTMYVVLAGGFDVLTAGGARLLTVPTGQVIGEIAFLLGRERTLDVRAATPTAQVLALSERTLTALIEERGPVAAKLLYGVARALAERLAAMDDAYAGPGA